MHQRHVHGHEQADLLGRGGKPCRPGECLERPLAHLVAAAETAPARDRQDEFEPGAVGDLCRRQIVLPTGQPALRHIGDGEPAIGIGREDPELQPVRAFQWMRFRHGWIPAAWSRKVADFSDTIMPEIVRHATTAGKYFKPEIARSFARSAFADMRQGILSRGNGMSDFREKCIGKASLIGTFAAIPHPVAVEVTAQAGLDFICIDWEHAQIARETIENLVRAADVHAVPAMVRVPGHAPEAIAAALDSGARGVLVPRVSTATQAQAAVKATRYPPLGERGVGPGRAAGYGYRIPEYLAAANAEIVVAVQVETAEGLANVDADRSNRRRRCGVRRSRRSLGIDRRHGAGGRRQARPGDRDDHRRPPWLTARSPASFAQSPRMSAIGPPRAPASSSWPATRCSSAPASRQATLLPAASFPPADRLDRERRSQAVPRGAIF